MIQFSKAYCKRAYIANECIWKTSALNSWNPVNQYIVSEGCFLCTMIRTFFLPRLLAKLDVVRIWIKHQNGCSLLQKTLEKLARQVRFACTCLSNNCQVATETIGIQQYGNIRAINQRSNLYACRHIYAEKLLQKRVGGNVDGATRSGSASGDPYYPFCEIPDNTSTSKHLWLRCIRAS